MKYVLAIPLAGLLLAQAGCSASDSGQTAPRVLFESRNRKYGLTSLFYGHDVKMDDGKREGVVEFVSLRRERDGAQAKFAPLDGATLTESSGYFQQVWSPDEETIVLPLGRYDGFAITRSSESLAKLTAGSSDDRIRVDLKTGTRLWHEFARWKGATCFEFTAGLSGQPVRFTYAIRARRLSTADSISGDFSAENASGPLAVIVEDASPQAGCEGPP